MNDNAAFGEHNPSVTALVCISHASFSRFILNIRYSQVFYRSFSVDKALLFTGNTALPRIRTIIAISSTLGHFLCGGRHFRSFSMWCAPFLQWVNYSAVSSYALLRIQIKPFKKAITLLISSKLYELHVGKVVS